jgi:hypothetical protein
VNREILFVQLQFYGIRHVAEDWFRCCVRNRRQEVEVTSPNSTKNFISDCGTLKHGVPQGSILPSLLFIIYIYIDDLPLRINSVSESVLFAGDSSVIISSRNVEDFCSMSNLVLSCVIKWFAANNLVLNEYNENHNKEFIAFYMTYCLQRKVCRRNK